MNAAVLLVAVASCCEAGRPFSWTGSYSFDPGRIMQSPPDVVEIPAGMAWEVTHYSGASQGISGQLPLFQLVGSSPNPNSAETTLLLAPSTIQTVDAGAETFRYWFNASTSAFFAGTAGFSVFRGPPNFSSGPAFAGISFNGTLVPLLAGDLNGDSAVNAADYTRYRDDLGAFSDASDFSAFAANYGAASAGVSPSPEPSGILLTLVALFLAASRDEGSPLGRRPNRHRG